MKCLLSPHPIPSGKVAASQLALIGSLIVAAARRPRRVQSQGGEGWREHVVVHQAGRVSS